MKSRSKTKKSLIDWISDTKSDFKSYDIRKIFIDTPREELLKKISIRTNLMFKKNVLKK